MYAIRSYYGFPSEVTTADTATSSLLSKSVVTIPKFPKVESKVPSLSYRTIAKFLSVSCDVPIKTIF